MTATERLDKPQLPAQAMEAERAVIASMMMSEQAVADVRAIVTPADLYSDNHGLLMSAILEITDRGQRADPATVLAAMVDRKQLAKIGGGPYIAQLYALPITPLNASTHARRIRAAAVRRQVQRLAISLDQNSDALDDEDFLDTLARQSLELDMIVDDRGNTDGPVEGLSTWDEFMDRPIERKWIVEDLIAAQNVFLTVAPAGAGKTTLSRQMVFCIAAGVHPFHPNRKITPRTTLLIDLENSADDVVAESRDLIAAVKRLGDWEPNRTHIWHRPEGIDLRKPAHAMELERVIAATGAEFVALGSLYKSFRRGRDDWEMAAEDTRAVFDRMRKKYGCAFWLEHHMPKAQGGTHSGNPYGSAVWQWWPSFGRVLERIGNSNYFTFEAKFRGDRGKRDIPVGLYRGGVLPWSPIFDQEELDVLSNAARNGGI